MKTYVVLRPLENVWVIGMFLKLIMEEIEVGLDGVGLDWQM